VVVSGLLALAGPPVSAGQPKDEGRLAIDVRILGIDGQPIDQWSSVTVWERVDAGSEVAPRDYTWTESPDGTVWRRVAGSISGEKGPTRNGKDRFLTRSRLRPGVYRATAFVGARKEGMLGTAVSEPIRLDGSQETTPVTIALQDGPALTFTVLDAETGKPVDHPRPGIVLTRPDGLEVESNPLNPRLFPADDGKYRIEHLAPGSYQVEVSAHSYSYGYPDYQLAEPMAIQVEPGKPSEIVLKIASRPIDEAEAEKRWPLAVEGTVTDDRGEPMEGVEIRAARGWGTLFSTMPVLSASDGRYRLRFGMARDGVQAAIISARKEGYSEKNLGQQGFLAMGQEIPEEKSDVDPERIILPGKPYRVDFTMLPAATIRGRLVDEAGRPLAEKQLYLEGDQTPPGANVAGSATTDQEGRFELRQVPPGRAWWLRLTERDLALPRTQPITLAPGEEYQLMLRATSGDGGMLRIARLKNSQDREVSAEMIGDDPRARPFVDAETTAKAREILAQMAKVNRCWFSVPSADGDSATGVKSFSYTFHLKGEEPREVTYEDYVNAKSWYREWYPKGISYTGAARVLTSLRERARFRDVQIGDEEISLYFVLEGASTVAAGNGISKTWSGFLSNPMKEGRIKIDGKRMTPISIEYGERKEEYDDYVAVAPDSYAPLSVQITGSMQFRWRFCVWKPGLWLFDNSASDSDEAVAWTTNVYVNGQPAECLADSLQTR